MKLLLIRHAEPDYSIDSLTQKGWREAALLGEYMRDAPVSAYYCSPLGRAGDTASFTLQNAGKTAEVLPWAREFVFPITDPETGQMSHIAWDLMPRYWTQRPALYEKDLWYDDPLMASGGAKEHCREVCSGLDALLTRHGYEREGGFYRATAANTETIALFCHLGVSCVMIGHLLGLSPVPLWQGLFLPPSSITTLVTEERENGVACFRCHCLGETPHLRAAREPISPSGSFPEIFTQQKG